MKCSVGKVGKKEWLFQHNNGWRHFVSQNYAGSVYFLEKKMHGAFENKCKKRRAKPRDRGIRKQS